MSAFFLFENLGVDDAAAFERYKRLVPATVEKHGKADKVGITKFRRRKHYLRQKGHRQPYTEVKVTGITAA